MMDRECIKGAKLVYHEKCYCLSSIPDSFSALRLACEKLLSFDFSLVRCYGVSVQGEFLLRDERDFQEFQSISPELNCFELEDPSAKVSVPIRLTSLVGMKCLHQHSFKLQSFSLETYSTQSTSLKLSAGFAFVFIDNGLFITGGSGADIRSAMVFRDDQLISQASLLTEHCSHLSVSNGQEVFVIGGMDSKMNFSRECESYQYSTKMWKSLPKLTTAVQFPTGCLFNNQLVVLAGTRIETLRREQWELLNLQLPEVYRVASMVQVREDLILLFGGLGSDKAAELNFRTLELTPVARVPMKSKYFMQSVRKYRGNVYVWGPNLEHIFTYHINEKHWSKVSLEFWEKRVGLLEIYAQSKRNLAFCNIWKLPGCVIRNICSQFL